MVDITLPQPAFMSSIEEAKRHYAEMRAARQKPVSFPEVDRRVSERRLSDRRSMQDALDDRDGKSDRRLQPVPTAHSAFVGL